MELLNACGEVAEAPTPFAELLSPLVWLDDGKTDLTMSLIDGEKEYLRYEKNGS
jgi:hypothetical protein